MPVFLGASPSNLVRRYVGCFPEGAGEGGISWMTFYLGRFPGEKSLLLKVEAFSHLGTSSTFRGSLIVRAWCSPALPVFRWIWRA